MEKKNPAAVALGRAGGRRGGPARAANLTPAQRSESARKAVEARWAKARKETGFAPVSTSDDAMLDILKRIKAANSPTQIRDLSEQLERVIFHRQHKAS
jgi:hypothetical protein